MNDSIQGTCWHCGQALTAIDYGRETNCPRCSKPTRVCRNCRHYTPGRPNDCIEPTVEPVLDFDLDIFSDWIETIQPEYIWLGYNSRSKQVDLPEPSDEKLISLISRLKTSGINIREKELREVSLN